MNDVLNKAYKWEWIGNLLEAFIENTLKKTQVLALVFQK